MEQDMKIASYIYFNNDAPSDLTQLWAKPEGNNEYSLNIYTNGAWRPLIGNGGKSAYEIAVDNGFSGSVEEWLLSLKGAQGIVGPQGEQGIEGEQGPQGEAGVGIVDISYSSETSTNTTYIMTFSDGSTFAFSIPKGAQGPKGDTGATGATGEQGPKGDKGDTGAAGTNGTNGIDGEDAYQPFKGWFDSLSNLESTLDSPEVGDYAYVKGATASDPIAIYQCTTAGTWADSGHEFNPANNQEFLSGESLNTVRIVDDLTTGGTGNVLSAKQGKELKGQIDALGPKIDQSTKNREIDFDNAPVGSLSIDGTVNGTSVNFNTTDYIPVEEGYKFVYKGYTGPTATTAICCGYNASKQLVSVIQVGAGSKTIETTIEVPSGVSYVRIAAANSGHSAYQGRYLYRGDLAGFNDFKSGESIVDVSIRHQLVNNNDLISGKGVSKVAAFELPFDAGTHIILSDGTAEGINVNFNVTGYIAVKPNSLIHYVGYLGAQYLAVCGYDENKQNPVSILAGNAASQDVYVNVPSSGVAYIRACAANSGHSSYVGRALELFDAQNLKDYFLYRLGLVNADIAANATAITNVKLQFSGESINFNNVGQLQLDGTVRTDLPTFNTSDFIPVNEGDVLIYKGHTGTTAAYAPIVGYDEEKGNATVLHATQSNVPFEVTIPSGVAYIRASAANSGHSSYQGRYCKIVPQYYRYVTDAINKRIDNINNQLYVVEDKVLTPTDAGAAIWCPLPTTLAEGEYYIKSTTMPTQVQVKDGYGGSYTTIRTIESFEVVGTNLYKFSILATDVAAGATWVRIAGATYSGFQCYKHTVTSRMDAIKHPLYGKKVAVLGDSISTIYGKNTPYIKIQASDVGNEIQSYISYLDVYGTDISSNPQSLGTTIGGVTLTADMIGTLQTFTPVAADVGKELGAAYNANGSGTKVWSEVLCENTGATLLANASFSGSSMCSGQSGIWAFTHAYSPMTIGRCRVRDEEGNFVNPDVIIIYRGTNDLSHVQGGGVYSMLDEWDLEANGYPSTDVYTDGGNTRYGFRRAYYMTIAALRAAYPNAIIYCCTLNVFKRVQYDRFPTRNGYYSLPDMNNVIRDIANHTGCGVIEFDKDGITFENCYSGGYITDSATIPTHPNSKGHEVMGRKAVEDLRHVL